MSAQHIQVANSAELTPGAIWAFDARSLSDRKYQLAWDAAVRDLFGQGLRPAEEPYYWEDHPTGVVSFYYLEEA